MQKALKWLFFPKNYKNRSAKPLLAAPVRLAHQLV